SLMMSVPCVAWGTRAAPDGACASRHELARLAVEESLPPNRRVELHRQVLSALEAHATGVSGIDYARAAYHAEAAGDAEAVLRYAAAAGHYAGELGASPAAAAPYAPARRCA